MILQYSTDRSRNHAFSLFILIFLHIAVPLVWHCLVVNSVNRIARRQAICLSGLVEKLFSVVLAMRRRNRRGQDARNYETKELNCSNPKRDHCQDEEAVVNKLNHDGFTGHGGDGRIAATRTAGAEHSVVPTAALQVCLDLLLRRRGEGVPGLLGERIHHLSAVDERVHCQRDFGCDEQNEEEAVKIEHTTRFSAAANAADEADEEDDSSTAHHQDGDRCQVRQS